MEKSSLSKRQCGTLCDTQRRRSYYLDGVCEEIKQLLDETGQATNCLRCCQVRNVVRLAAGQASLVTLAQKFSLPAVFVQEVRSFRSAWRQHGCVICRQSSSG